MIHWIWLIPAVFFGMIVAIWVIAMTNHRD